MKVVLTKVTRYTTDKSGKPLINKNGKPYTRVNIQTREHGDKWLSGFENATTRDWKEGSEVEIITTQNGEYLNFETPKQEAQGIKELREAAQKKFKEIEAEIFAIKVHVGLDADPDAIDKAFENRGQETIDEPPIEAYSEDEIQTEEIF